MDADEWRILGTCVGVLVGRILLALTGWPRWFEPAPAAAPVVPGPDEVSAVLACADRITREAADAAG